MKSRYPYLIIGGAVVLAYVLLSLGITSQNSAVAVNNNETSELFITGNAIKSIKPDRVSIVLTLETDGKTAGEVNKQNAEAMNRVIDVLNRLGISNDEISTNYYNLYPVYAPKRSDEVCIAIYPPPPECIEQVIIGYKAINSIRVETSIDDNIGRIIDESVSAGINRVDSVSFFVSNELQNEIVNQLLEEAVNDAKEKAELVLRPLNMQIIGVKNISTGYFPIHSPVYAANGLKESFTPILPSEQQISVSVNVTFLIG